MTADMNDPRNALAAKMFPREWAANEADTAGRRRGHRRAALRERAATTIKVDAARAQGGSCANCDMHSEPHAMSLDRNKGLLVCDYDTDFHGTAYVKPDHICSRWAAIKAKDSANG